MEERTARLEVRREVRAWRRRLAGRMDMLNDWLQAYNSGEWEYVSLFHSRRRGKKPVRTTRVRRKMMREDAERVVAEPIRFKRTSDPDMVNFSFVGANGKPQTYVLTKVPYEDIAGVPAAEQRRREQRALMPDSIRLRDVPVPGADPRYRLDWKSEGAATTMVLRIKGQDGAARWSWKRMGPEYSESPERYASAVRHHLVRRRDAAQFDKGSSRELRSAFSKRAMQSGLGDALADVVIAELDRLVERRRRVGAADGDGRRGERAGVRALLASAEAKSEPRKGLQRDGARLSANEDFNLIAPGVLRDGLDGMIRASLARNRLACGCGDDAVRTIAKRVRANIGKYARKGPMDEDDVVDAIDDAILDAAQCCADEGVREDGQEDR